MLRQCKRSFDLENVNTLPDHLMRFDVVVANPPFSLDKWWDENGGADPYKRFTPHMPPKSRGDYAFASRIAIRMLEYGCMGPPFAWPVGIYRPNLPRPICRVGENRRGSRRHR